MQVKIFNEKNELLKTHLYSRRRMFFKQLNQYWECPFIHYSLLTVWVASTSFTYKVKPCSTQTIYRQITELNQIYTYQYKLTTESFWLFTCRPTYIYLQINILYFRNQYGRAAGLNLECCTPGTRSPPGLYPSVPECCIPGHLDRCDLLMHPQNGENITWWLSRIYRWIHADAGSRP